MGGRTASDKDLGPRREDSFLPGSEKDAGQAAGGRGGNVVRSAASTRMSLSTDETIAAMG